MKVAGAVILAAVAFVLAVAFGMPALANQLGPLVPIELERRLGDDVDADVRKILAYELEGEFECGTSAEHDPGRAALASLVGQLEASASLAFPLEVSVVRVEDEVNALALPAGRIYLLEGLIDEVTNADELAGVIAHEMGHVAHRDGTRAILQSYGLSFLFGLLPIDLSVARDLLLASYSRDREFAADRYGAELLGKVGADPRAITTLLPRLEDPIPGLEFLSGHPNSAARIEAVEALPPTPLSSTPLLGPDEWDALKLICSD